MPPNLLLIITDHVAWHGHYGGRGDFSYRWPAFERLCREGCHFTRARTIAPVCTPARTSMMTGLRPARHGLVGNTEAAGLGDLRPGIPLFTDSLRAAGYRCAYVGKWHCGHARLPADHGLEGWSLPDYGQVYRSAAYCAHAEARGLRPVARIEHQLDHPEWVGSERDLAADASPFTAMNGSGILLGPAEAHEATFLGLEGIRWVGELSRGRQPWCLILSFWGPHHPFFPSEPWASAIDPAAIPEHPSFRDDLHGRPLRHHLAAATRHPGRLAWGRDWAVWQRILARAYGQALQTDAAIGQVLAQLDACGHSANTLVACTADHGDSLASHGGMWDKGAAFYEELARIPLALRWPARIAPASSDALACNIDLPATLLDAAGIAVPVEWDAQSLLPLCGGAAGRDELLCEHTLAGALPQRALYRGGWKYTACLYDSHELYDLESDPSEQRNLIADPDHAAVREELAKRVRVRMESSPIWAEQQLAHAIRLGQR